MNDNNNSEILNVVKMMAAATNSPFKTAFKASLGIAAAQLVVIVSMITIFLGIVALTGYFLTK